VRSAPGGWDRQGGRRQNHGQADADFHFSEADQAGGSGGGSRADSPHDEIVSPREKQQAAEQKPLWFPTMMPYAVP